MKRPGEVEGAVFQPQRRRRTPEAEKHLSYERDCVNDYGENDKASRKAIPRFKAESNRKKRRHAKQVLPLITDSELPESVDASLADSENALPRKTKGRDVPLGSVLAERKSGHRQSMDMPLSNNRRESVIALINENGIGGFDDIASQKRREHKAKNDR